MTQLDVRVARLLDRLLETLIDLPPAERERRLHMLQANRPELAERLSRMLGFALAPETEGALAPGGALQGELASELLGARDVLAPGEVFCGFRIQARIGQGGMSDVYRATRDHGEFASTVALKLIHRGADDGALRAFFLHEQRALSRLEHPGIARFIDAGESPDGQLYLAMEYVDGEAILDHADRQGLSLRARVDLLIELCRALEHAHARRLVHGDVKSANVLVDAAGRLRLVDFGIASDTELGRPGRRQAFTAECAAPEQLRGEGTTTATDVFQVGALAYRLLAGRSRLATERAPGAPLLSVSAAAGTGDAPEVNARARRRALPNGHALVSALRGDLDAIVACCLRDRPDQRYGNCTELREDLQAWRRVRPLRARPEGRLRRAGRFLRRNARAAAIVAVVVLALVASSSVFLYRLRAVELTRLAEADRAVRVEQFLAELFRTGSPYLRQDGRDPLAIFADLGAALLRDSGEMDPRTQARIGLSLAQLQLARGDHRQALVLLEAARQSLGDAAGNAPGLGAELLQATATARSETGAGNDAIADQEASLTLLASAGAPAQDYALAQARLADLLRRNGRNDEAAAQFAQAMPRVLAIEPATLDAIRAIDGHVRFLGQNGDVDALQTLRPVLTARVERVAAASLAEAELTSILAEIDSAIDGPAAAAQRFEQAASRFGALLGEQHPRVARALTDACVSNIEHGQMAAARVQCQRALAIYYQSNGPESSGVAVASSNLGVIAYNTGAFEEADGYVQRAQRLFDQGEQPFQTLFGRLMQGRLAVARGHYDQALDHLERAEAIRAAALPDNAGLALEIAEQRAFALIGTGDADAADTALAQAGMAPSDRVAADRQRNLAWADVARAQIAGLRRDAAALSASIAAALEGYARMPGRNALESAWLHAELGTAAWSGGERQRARELFDAALAGMTPDGNGAHWAMAWAGVRLAGAPGVAATDAEARALLLEHRVVTDLARAYLALR